jgi:hypothetical protein
MTDGGTLILYIGEVTSAKPKRTQWRLWIDVAWRVSHYDELLVGSLDDGTYVTTIISMLRGAVITSAKPIGPWNDLRIEFRDGYLLESFTYSTMDDAWELRSADGRRFGCTFPGGLYEKLEDADKGSFRIVDSREGV